MKINNRFIYKLKDRLGVLAVVPLGESDFTLEYERENEDKIDYKKSLSGKIKFVGDAFKRLMQMETSIYRCDEQTLTIYKDCEGVEKEIFVGKISLNEGDFNLDRCEIILTFLEDNKDKCYNDSKTTKINLFQFISNRIIAKTNYQGGVIESKNCSKVGTGVLDNFYWCGSGTPQDGNWTATRVSANSNGVHSSVNNTWKRELIEIDCSETPETDWILVEDNCSTTGKKKFAKLVTLINCSSYGTNPGDSGSYSYNYSCDVLGYDGGLTMIDNGLHFNDVMKELLLAVCPNLTLKSDFFQINPENPSGTNYVTGKSSRTNNIIIFQKSDVKRPTATNNASKLEITLEDMLEVLKIMFNVKWRIEGNVFKLEHVSYFSKNIGIDVTVNELKKYFVGKNAYSYQSAKIPQKEIFKFKEQQGKDWDLEVVYSGCISDTKKNEQINIIDEAMTDIVFAMDNPDSDSKFVEDLGFVLVSTRKINNEYYINSEASTNGSRLNNVFAWVQLFRDYHYYERPMKTGKVNGTLTEFITTIPTKKGDRFSIPLNPCSLLNPDDFIKTGLGNGIIDSGKYRFKDSMIELELLYESNQDLSPNEAPVLTGGGVYETYKNVSKIIDIQATDADGFITAINVVYPPYLGTVNILSFNQIEYIPNTGVTGFDTFSLQAVDNISEVSNLASFGITILNENVPPIAVDDEYFVWIGEAFNQGVSILNNDSDDYNLITITTTTVTTVQGIVVNIDSNGFFDYTPPNGFEGEDSFQYSIKDDLNNVSTATVSLKVGYKNKPIAVTDFYQVLKNNTLNVDGVGLGKNKITENDYTADGMVYSYTTTAETKPTSQGGSVVINIDGTFVYTPPTDFTGIDSFNYTVSNSNGSGTGLVKISVLPTIFVKLKFNDDNYVYDPNNNISYSSKDYILNFFSDSSGLVPFDVSGMNFKVIMKEKTMIVHSSSTTTFFETDFLDGIETKILDDYVYSENNINRLIEINPNPNYQIII